MEIRLLKSYDRFIGLIWMALAVNFTIQNMQAAPFTEAALATVFILLAAYPLATYLSTTLLRRAMSRRKMKAFTVQFFLVSAAVTVLLLCALGLFLWLETAGVFVPSELFARSESSPGEIVFNFLLVSLFINFGFCGLRFFEENVRLQEELAHSQMEILKTQINPHFMFNVLNHIHVLMQRDVELASSLLLQYADILRYQLYQAREEQVTVGQEVAFMKNYIEVEKMRWQGRLSVRTRWEVENAGCHLAPLLMVTFIENAFKHATTRRDGQKGYVDITFEGKDKEVTLRVENSGVPHTARPAGNAGNTGNAGSAGIGLDNIRKRLDILYPGRYVLQIGDTDEAYHLCFTLKIS